MYLVTGLGNPGQDYENTRHNFGEVVVAALVDQLGQGSWSAWKGHRVAKFRDPEVVCFIDDEFMNLAGGPLGEFLRYQNDVVPRQVIVVHDELDLPFGRLQLKLGGSAGGHNGVQSVIDQLGTDQFWRLRLGIGRPESVTAQAEISQYVLSRFRADEVPGVSQIVDEAVALLIQSIKTSPTSATKTVDLQKK